MHLVAELRLKYSVNFILIPIENHYNRYPIIIPLSYLISLIEIAYPPPTAAFKFNFVLFVTFFLVIV